MEPPLAFSFWFALHWSMIKAADTIISSSCNSSIDVIFVWKLLIVSACNWTHLFFCRATSDRIGVGGIPTDSLRVSRYAPPFYPPFSASGRSWPCLPLYSDLVGSPWRWLLLSTPLQPLQITLVDQQACSLECLLSGLSHLVWSLQRELCLFWALLNQKLHPTIKMGAMVSSAK